MTSGPLAMSALLSVDECESEFLHHFLGRSIYVPTLGLGQANAMWCPRHGGLALNCKLSRYFDHGDSTRKPKDGPLPNATP
jgi:hypothetical protein